MDFALTVLNFAGLGFSARKMQGDIECSLRILGVRFFGWFFG